MSDVYYISHGRVIRDINLVPPGMLVQALPRLLGGKGGFGSMLRAIGSQIEKTTNREMCRDLTGRRMRDVNMEKQLKEWLSKASQRDREKIEKQLERRKKRRELLEKGPLVGHKFEDAKYDQQKSFIAEQLENALEAVLNETQENKSKPSTSGFEPPTKKKRLLFDQEEEDLLNELSSSSSDASSDNDIDAGNEEVEDNKCKQSSDEGICQDTKDTELENSNIKQSTSSLPVESEQNDTKKIESTAAISFSIEEATSPSQLEQFGLDTLKMELMNRGLKCGGTLSERAIRLFSVLKLEPDDYPANLKAKPLKRK